MNLIKARPRSKAWNVSVHLMNINKLLKPILKIRQRKIALNQTLTLKLGATLVLTVTQVYVFVTYAE